MDVSWSIIIWIFLNPVNLLWKGHTHMCFVHYMYMYMYIFRLALYLHVHVRSYLFIFISELVWGKPTVHGSAFSVQRVGLAHTCSTYNAQHSTSSSSYIMHFIVYLCVSIFAGTYGWKIYQKPSHLPLQHMQTHFYLLGTEVWSKTL